MSENAARPDNVKLAVAVIVGTVLALSLGDALIKKTSADMVLWQIFVLRSLVALPVLAIILRTRFRGVSALPEACGWVTLRSLMLTLMWVFYYASLPHLQFSIAAAAYYTLPIFITLFSALFVSERVGRGGWLAIALGFLGVTLILKPAASSFSVYAVLPLISAMLYAGAMILTRTKCQREHPLVLAGSLNVSFIVVGIFVTLWGVLAGGSDTPSSFLSTTWTEMSANELLAVLLLGVAILIATIGTAIAYQVGPSSVVATFDFSYVGFAVIWGLVFFGEVPDTVSVFGMIMIVIAGVLAVRR